MTRKLALSSVLTAIAAVFTAAAVLAPTGRLAFLMLASVCTLVAVIECGTRYAVLAYTAAAVISAVFLPFKAQTLAYIAFLGYYPIIKRYIERLQNLVLEWLTKIMFFSAVMVTVYLLFRYALLPNLDFGATLQIVFNHIPLVALALEAVFVLYDYLLSMFASYYCNVLQKKWKNRKV